MKLLITHIDLDGCGSLIINSIFDIKFDKINFTNYGDSNELEFLEELKKDDIVVYTDFSPNESARKLIKLSNCKCIIYDHHESVYDEISKWEYDNFEYHYDISKSGTKIYYDLIKNNYPNNLVLNEFVELVSVYDLYQKTSPLWEMADKLNRCFFKTLTYYKQGADKFMSFIKNQVYKCTNFTEFKFSSWEQEKIDKDIQEEEEIFNELVLHSAKLLKTRKDEDGNYFVVVKLNKKISAIASRILNKWKKLQYVIVINTYKNDDWKISIRSRDDFNMLEYKGVKGHPSACAIENCTHDVAKSIWEGKFYCLEKNH